MTDAKTSISDQVVADFLADEGMAVTALERITGGETSQAFLVKTQEKEFVLRVNKSRAGFDKDAFAAQYFFFFFLPIPQIHFIKESSGFYFCMSDKARGEQVYEEYLEKNPGTIHSLFKTLSAIHATDLTHFSGYGKWDTQGHGENVSWKEYLIAMHDVAHWQQLAADGVLELDLLNGLFSQLEELLPILPEERKLIHADPANDNMFALDARVTAVTDWDQSMYGDPLFDIAWLEFWADTIDFVEEYKQYCDAHGIFHENYEARIKAYLLYLAITTLLWYIEVNSPDGYHWLRKRLHEKFGF